MPSGKCAKTIAMAVYFTMRARQVERMVRIERPDGAIALL